MRVVVVVLAVLMMGCAASGGGGGSSDSSDLGVDVKQGDSGECTPSCAGKICGDDGCGASCGGCQLGLFCNPEGQCVDECTPSCAGKVCGSDGCGGSCGDCPDNGSTCSAGQCVLQCTPDCGGKECGDDGCGSTCGACSKGEECSEAGVCEELPPVTYSSDAQPVFANFCANCHKGNAPKSCKGNACIISFYQDTQKNAKSCFGKTVGECSLQRMINGSMPPGPGKVPQAAVDIIQAWVDDGQLP